MHLQKLEIQKCESMEVVIDATTLGRDEKQGIGLMVFPKLDYLELSSLPKLTRFISMSSSQESNILYNETQPLFDEKVFKSFSF